MDTKFIEAINQKAGGQNWGKFLLARFTSEEWSRRSEVGGNIMLRERGWTPEHLLVLDLQTGEGAIFRPGGYAWADLNDKHQIWVCPLFQPFLTWLYTQDVRDIQKLPTSVELDVPETLLHGHRRQGKQP